MGAALVLGTLLAIVGPTAAVVIGRQVAKLESQLSERDRLIAEQERRVDALEAAKDAEGIHAQRTEIDPIRVVAIERMLASDGPRLIEAARKSPPDTTEGITARVATARLLLAAGSDADAAKLLAEIGETTEPAKSPEMKELRDALMAAEKLRSSLQENRHGAAGVQAVANLRAVTTPKLPAGELTAQDIASFAEVLLQREPANSANKHE